MTHVSEKNGDISLALPPFGYVLSPYGSSSRTYGRGTTHSTTICYLPYSVVSHKVQTTSGVSDKMPNARPKVSTLPAVAITERGCNTISTALGIQSAPPGRYPARQKNKRSAVDTAPTMDDDDGFTMVDETFGVREPSDCSDQEEEEENPPRFQKVTLVPGGPVQLGEESSSTAPVASSPHVPLATSSDDDSHVLLTALSGMESADTQGGASKTASRGVLAMLRRGINPESADAGQVIITSDKPSMLRETASSASTPGLKIPAAAAPTTAAVVVQDTPSEIGPGGPPGPSASTKKDSKEMNAIVIPASLVPAAKPNKASSINCVATTTPSGAAAAVTSPSRRSEPTASAATPSSGAAAPNAQALIRKAVFVALAADPAAAAEEEEKPATTKTLTVRLVPGDCAFRAAVPRTGPGSLNTVAHVKREIERKLGLRQLVHLSFVVVSAHVARAFSLVSQSPMLYCCSRRFISLRKEKRLMDFIISFPVPGRRYTGVSYFGTCRRTCGTY